jgi:HAD superfamily hydrolase (TIGR01509 family)
MPSDGAEPQPTVLLCDADGTLFPSEQPAFEAAAAVLCEAMAELGLARTLDGDELRRQASGRNFRRLLRDLVNDAGCRVPPAFIDRWVHVESTVVTRHLSDRLRPDPQVIAALTTLQRGMRLALVSSSASRRLDACLDVTALDGFFPASDRFSAQDSLSVPSSKPDPAIYIEACRRLHVEPQRAVAVEDATAGVTSAVSAGVPVVGILCFVPARERADRHDQLLSAGAATVVADWAELASVVATSTESSSRPSETGDHWLTSFHPIARPNTLEIL